MRIIFMTPGSGDNFYCENCIRDKALVMALRSRGHDAVSVPLYLPPLMEDTNPGTDSPVFFGGVNVYLQQNIPLFRRTPRWLDRWLDHPRLLTFAARMAGMTNAAQLGETTLSMLRGEEGRQCKELRRLVAYLQAHFRPDAVVLSNALLLGLADRLGGDLGCRLVCLLQDEDEFVESLGPAYAPRVWDLMRETSRRIDAFVASSRYYAAIMADRLGLPENEIRVVRSGIDPEGYVPAAAPPDPPAVGFLSRMCAGKGLDVLTEEYIRLKQDARFDTLRLKIAGGMSAADEKFVASIRRRLRRAGVAEHVDWLDDFDRSDKREYLPALTALCVPDRGEPASAVFVAESLVAGVPVVLPERGVLPELVELTGGGVMYDPDTADGLHDALNGMLSDPARAHRMGMEGRAAAMETLTADVSARGLAKVLET